MESMGVVSGRGQQEVGVASGWNLYVWLPYVSALNGCCCINCYRRTVKAFVTVRAIANDGHERCDK